MSGHQLQKSNIDFLKQLRANNNKEWFTENKSLYEHELEEMRSFSDDLINQMNQLDDIETPSGKKSLFRIYRDVRFSKDKTPYKSHWSGHMRRATKWLRGGYYYHIEPGGSFVAGGFWGPNKDDLLHIRNQIANDPNTFRSIINDPLFKKTFGELQGDQLKTAPRDFPKDHEAVDLLRYKGFVVRRDFKDKEVLSPNFTKDIVQTYQYMRPFLNYMSEILTTDLNGEALG